MLRTRIIPCLQLIDDSLVKTVKFKDPSYIGDPINTVRIFNELEVDELCFLDIRATSQKRQINFDQLAEITNECFMPLSYGGGIKTFKDASRLFTMGFEKIVLNTAAYYNPDLVTKCAEHYGSQAIIGSIDVKKNMFGKYQVYVNNGKDKIKDDVISWAKKLQDLGVGEILLTAISNEGTWDGMDVALISQITKTLDIPVIAHGGAGSLSHITDSVKNGGASAIGLGSMVVYQKKGMGVLVNFPDKSDLESALN